MSDVTFQLHFFIAILPAMNTRPDGSMQRAGHQAASHPFASDRGTRVLSHRVLSILGVLALVVLIGVGTGTAQSVWQRIAQFIGLRGKPEPASANVLSEHEITALDEMSAQSQASLLLERSINHYRGANDQIAARVDRWRGKIELDQHLGSLFSVALNSDDLRVRAAAIEVDLAAYNLEKTSAAIDALE